MRHEEGKIAAAYWVEPARGWVELSADWHEQQLPPLALESSDIELKSLQRAEPEFFAKYSGYYVNATHVHFIVFPKEHGYLNWAGDVGLYVAGEFNNWAAAIGENQWRLRKDDTDPDEPVYRLSVPINKFPVDKAVRFKFVTAEKYWLGIPPYVPNVVFDETGISNYLFDPKCTGANAFLFEVDIPRAITGEHTLVWQDNGHSEHRPIEAGPFFYALSSEYPMGARVKVGKTIFHLFAPRANKVTLHYSRKYPAKDKDYTTVELKLLDDGLTWETIIPENLHGTYYYYTVDGHNKDNLSHFNPKQKLLDPWALATVTHEGPGIVVDATQLPKSPRPFIPPKWHDLVIMEAHVRDLVAHAPIDLNAQERLGFAGLTKWVQAQGSYLQEIGVNCVELQPIQQFDSPKQEDYHWGYMTTNYFAPSAWYAQDPENASQLDEFAQCVKAFHKQNIAVILDVVYNHVGEPPFLVFIDKQYYFDLDDKGNLMNWSGCGNTLRANTPMAKRLIIESLTHLVETFDIDGFRFDLAELLGKEVLLEIEDALKRVKPGIILIAEPWSFRGHIAGSLKDTGWAFWNDGYRDFMVDYFTGNGNQDGIKYFLAGSLAHLTSFPAQTINYVESHDDYCWLDRITENPDHNGEHPTHNDRLRTHLMFATLMASLGTPMFSAGQDMLRSKQGIHNTYLRGDINALRYERADQHSQTHHYFKGWIAFRLSEQGKLLRLQDKPADHYIQYYTTDGTSAIAALYNNDGSQGDNRILYAVNPHNETVYLHTHGFAPQDMRQLCDTAQFNTQGIENSPVKLYEDGAIELPPLSCGLWIKKKDR